MDLTGPRRASTVRDRVPAAAEDAPHWRVGYSGTTARSPSQPTRWVGVSRTRPGSAAAGIRGTRGGVANCYSGRSVRTIRAPSDLPSAVGSYASRSMSGARKCGARSWARSSRKCDPAGRRQQDGSRLRPGRASDGSRAICLPPSETLGDPPEARDVWPVSFHARSMANGAIDERSCRPRDTVSYRRHVAHAQPRGDAPRFTCFCSISPRQAPVSRLRDSMNFLNRLRSAVIRPDTTPMAAAIFSTAPSGS